MYLLISSEGNGTPLQNSCLENPMDGGAWKAAVHGVANSRTRLSDFTFTFHFHALEKEMATHSSVLAWRIPGTGEPGGLPSVGLHRVGHDWSDLAVAVLCLLPVKLTFSQCSFSSELLKRKPCPKMASLILKLITYTHDTKPRFNTWPNCSFSLSQKCNHNQPVWNFLISTNK